jgi:hypothetical protein
MKYITRLLHLLIIGFAFALTSCIEITQQIDVNRDKTGTYTLKIDLGLLNYAGSDGMDAMGFLAGIKEMPAKAVGKLQAADGLSSVENISDEGKGIFGFRFNFANDKALNKALYDLADQQKLFFMPDFIKIRRNKIKMTDIAPYVKKANSMSQDKQDQAYSFMNDQISQYIFFNTVLQLPSAVKKASNSRSEILDNQVKLRSSLSDLVKGIDFGNVVKY